MLKTVFQYQPDAAFRPGNNDVAVMIAGGTIFGAIGLVMIITGKSNKTE